MHILAGQGGLPPGFAAMELTVPPRFAGPIPHAHDEFDEAIYVLSGRLLVHGDGEPAEAGPGTPAACSPDPSRWRGRDRGDLGRVGRV